MNYAERKAFGDKVEKSFDDLCKKYGYQIIDTAIEKKRFDTWNMNMSNQESDDFWNIDVNPFCKESDVKSCIKWFNKNNAGKTPASKRYGPDRVIIYKDKYWKNEEKRCGFSIKSKAKDSHKFYMIEAMDVFAHSENIGLYDCEIYYVFPPDNVYAEWRFCSDQELLHVAEYIEPPLSWKGSKKPCYKVPCKLIYKPLWILFETNFSWYAGSI
jgi:hypothetical protein